MGERWDEERRYERWDGKWDEIYDVNSLIFSSTISWSTISFYLIYHLISSTISPSTTSYLIHLGIGEYLSSFYHLPSHIISHLIYHHPISHFIGIGEYLSSKAENDFTRSEREREEWWDRYKMVDEIRWWFSLSLTIYHLIIYHLSHLISQGGGKL